MFLSLLTSELGRTGLKHIEEIKRDALTFHLIELRYRLIISLAVIFVFFSVAFYFSADLINLLKKPLIDSFPSQELSRLYFTGPLDVLFASLRVAFLVGFIASAPVWLYQFWKFVEPALYPRERRYLIPIFFASLLLFLGGLSFCYFLMLPVALEVLIKLGLDVGSPIITITDYVSLLTTMMLGFGIIFETPVVLILLSLLGVIDAATLSRHRRGVFVVILIISAIITPTIDPFNQLAMAIPTYFMYEVSILVIRILGRKKKLTETSGETS